MFGADEQEQYCMYTEDEMNVQRNKAAFWKGFAVGAFGTFAILLFIGWLSGV